MEKKTYEGTMFVVPNPRLGERASREALLNRHWEGVKKKLEEFGVAFDKTQPLEVVQVRVTGSGSNNWECHGMPGTDWDEVPDCEIVRFPQHLPVSLLEGKRDGDVIVLDASYGTLKITLKQNNCYGIGTFQEAIELLKKHKLDHYFDPDYDHI